MTDIGKVAVLGAGTMGAGIAAQIANSGVPVRLYDLDRSAATTGLEGLLTRKPAPLMSPTVVQRIAPGGFDDLGDIGDCDWIVEAVVEKLEPKQALYRSVTAHCHADAIVTSNTSGLLLRDLTAGFPARFAQTTLITHFFNPPRYMPLVELVSGPETRPEVSARIATFCRDRLGKVVVPAKDTPCFIANRIGVMNLVAGLRFAVETGLTVEQADALAGRPMGFPGTGLFGLLDLVGFDVVQLVCQNLRAQLAADDPARPFLELPAVGRHMLEKGLVGRKAGAGFYRLKVDSREREVMDLRALEYRDFKAPDLPGGRARDPVELLAATDVGGEFAWRLLSTTLTYAATVAEQVADNIVAVDTAMREGFSWRWGPFELLDRIGPRQVADRLAGEGRPVPALLAATVRGDSGTFYRQEETARRFWTFSGGYADERPDDKAWSISQVAAGRVPLASNAAATLWDGGDGVALLALHSKMNAIGEETLAALEDAAQRAGKDYQALVVGTDAKHFSVGANLQVMLDAARANRQEFLDGFIARLQRAFMALRFAPCPVVMAVRGYALGGGCELALHGDRVQAHAECSIGLVEVGVGLIPAGGGCKEMLRRQAEHGGSAAAFELIVKGITSGSAQHARELSLLDGADGVTMHRDHLLAAAKQFALRLAGGYAPPAQAKLPACPERRADLVAAVAARVDIGEAAPHDAVVAERLAWVLTGGDAGGGSLLTESNLLDLERAAFLELLALEASQARMAHMLDTGKPLRN